MKNIVKEVDIEYLKKYVNFGNRTTPIKNLQKNAVFLFIMFPLIGLILSSSDWMNSLALRIIYLAIMVGGIIGTIASEKWFSGNRNYLFNAWLGGAGICVTFILIGLFMVYGVSKILFLIFIIIQTVVIIMAIVKTLNYISNKKSPEDNVKQGRYYGLGGCLGYFGGILFSRAMEGVSEDMTRIILATIAMVVPTLIIVFYVEIFIQFYYAVKYKIEIFNTWDAKT